jgi:AraC family transcriptional regulator of adaptative response/methylated-DNA-[protein]-cysteine methyltransferase
VPLTSRPGFADLVPALGSLVRCYAMMAQETGRRGAAAARCSLLQQNEERAMTTAAVAHIVPSSAKLAAGPEAERLLPFNRQVAAAIRHVVEHYQEQPSLEDMAAAAGMSPFHFQRVFKRWAGISPKRFLQFVTLAHAKRALAGDASVLDAALDSGLSGPSRLHDLFVHCTALTPGEFKALGERLVIRWGVHDVPLGRVLIATTRRGVCWLAFIDDNEPAVIAEFEREWRGARLLRDDGGTAGAAARAFEIAASGPEPLPLLVRGTNFQLKVWEALLKIPFGRLVSYQAIARAIGQPRAVRAVGRAVGANSISWLIPCHRVILATGIIHNYRWGVRQKQILVGFEAALAQASA